MAVDDKEYQKRISRGHTVTKTDRFSYWLSKNLMVVINLIIFIYVGLPFLAPVLMKANAVGPARVIYAIYRRYATNWVFDHGSCLEQLYYPRDLAGIPGIKPLKRKPDYLGQNI